jgi:hypothetical protein
MEDPAFGWQFIAYIVPTIELLGLVLDRVPFWWSLTTGDGSAGACIWGSLGRPAGSREFTPSTMGRPKETFVFQNANSWCSTRYVYIV